MQYLSVSGRRDGAVSPVVGVMLMLVVVIIIAAVVSGFTGGLVGSASQKAPTLAMDVKVINTGSYAGSGFFAYVTSVSKPIPSEDIKIVTSWTAANEGISGGNTTLPLVVNTHYLHAGGSGQGLGYDGYATGSAWGGYMIGSTMVKGWIAPWGGGPGINGSIVAGYSNDVNPSTYMRPKMQFGFYTLVPGTTMSAIPCGQGGPRRIAGSTASGTGTDRNALVSSEGYGVTTPYFYSGGPFSDATTAVFGAKWETLREGDKVNVKVIHIPTGKVIFNKDVAVTEG